MNFSIINLNSANFLLILFFSYLFRCLDEILIYVAPHMSKINSIHRHQDKIIIYKRRTELYFEIISCSTIIIIMDRRCSIEIYIYFLLIT